jgi:hypothetical protein
MMHEELTFAILEKNNCIKGFKEQKSGKRKFLFITQDFIDFAIKIKWSSMKYSDNWIEEKMRKYEIWPHAFRAGFVTLSGELKSLYRAQTAIGHASHKTTRIYLSRDYEIAKEKYEKRFNFEALGINKILSEINYECIKKS